METVIHTPGSLSVPGLSEAFDEYATRITDWPLHHVSGRPTSPGPTEIWVGLTLDGTMIRTEALHRWLQEQANQSVRRVRFLIGGKTGLDPETVQQTRWQWCLGPLVMNQSIAALVVAEQLYRCHALRTGHPYHEPEDSGGR